MALFRIPPRGWLAIGGASMVALGVGAAGFRGAPRRGLAGSKLSLLATGDVWGEVEPCG